MRLRTYNFSSTVICAVVLAGASLGVFAAANAGIDPRDNHFESFDPKMAASMCFSILGMYHAIAIVFFDEADSESATDETGRRIPTTPDSYTGFIRQPWYKVFTVGPVFAACCAASVFIWHAFANFPGNTGTLWGDYSVSPLPAFAFFLACWTATNIGFTFAAVAEAFNRDHRRLFMTFFFLMFAAAGGVAFGFTVMQKQPTDHVLTLLAVAFPLSLLTSIGAYIWAVVRVAHFDAQRTPLRDGPPTDMLEPGEQLILHIRSDRTPEPQLLIATTNRFVRASILHPDRTYVLDQASPGQLLGGSSERMGLDLVTTAHFRDRQDMRIVGGDPAQSQAFAQAISHLARTGRVG